MALNLLHVVDRFDERYANNDQIQTVLALARRNHVLKVLTSRFGENYEEIPRPTGSYSGVAVYRMPGFQFRSPFSNFRLAIFALPKMSYKSLDAVQLYNFFTYSYFLAPILSRFSTKAIIVLRTEVDSPINWYRLTSSPFRTISEAYSKYIDAFTAFTPVGVSRLLSLGFDRRKVFQVPPLIDRRPFLDLVGRKKGSHFTVGFIGSIARVKGLDLVLNSLVKFLKAHSEAMLLFAGTVEDREYADGLFRVLGTQKNFRFLGPVFPPFGFYEQVDVVIMPSRHEAGPTVPLETMSSGRVLIVSNVYPLNSWVQHGVNGLVAGNEDEFYRCLEQSMNEWKTLSSEAVKSSVRFDSERVARHLESIYSRSNSPPISA